MVDITNLYTCKICKAEFLLRRQIRNHLKDVHKIQHKGHLLLGSQTTFKEFYTVQLATIKKCCERRKRSRLLESTTPTTAKRISKRKVDLNGEH